MQKSSLSLSSSISSLKRPLPKKIKYIFQTQCILCIIPCQRIVGLKKGKKFEIKSNTGRDRVNINGAIEIESQTLVIEECETVNAQSTIALFDKMQSQQKEGKLFVIAYNARYYKCQLIAEYVQQNPRVVLVFLPTYAPNLNIHRTVVEVLQKENHLQYLLPTFREYKKACLLFFKNIDPYHAELCTLLTDNFRIINSILFLESYRILV
jgi:hypothetical protein